MKRVVEKWPARVVSDEKVLEKQPACRVSDKQPADLIMIKSPRNRDFRIDNWNLYGRYDDADKSNYIKRAHQIPH